MHTFAQHTWKNENFINEWCANKITSFHDGSGTSVPVFIAVSNLFDIELIMGNDDLKRHAITFAMKVQGLTISRTMNNLRK